MTIIGFAFYASSWSETAARPLQLAGVAGFLSIWLLKMMHCFNTSINYLAILRLISNNSDIGAKRASVRLNGRFNIN